jgi:hypothetical protein
MLAERGLELMPRRSTETLISLDNIMCYTCFTHKPSGCCISHFALRLGKLVGEDGFRIDVPFTIVRTLYTHSKHRLEPMPRGPAKTFCLRSAQKVIYKCKHPPLGCCSSHSLLRSENWIDDVDFRIFFYENT